MVVLQNLDMRGIKDYMEKSDVYNMESGGRCSCWKTSTTVVVFKKFLLIITMFGQI